MLDVSRLQPEARPIVEAAAAIYIRHTEPWLVGLIAHGSSVKGDFIPGCSDIDLQLYLEDAAFVAEETLPFELGMAIHRDLSKLDPAPFQYIQCYPHRRWLPEGYIGPIPSAYIVLAGTLPVAEATADQLRESARATLAELDPQPRFVLHTLLQCGGGKLARQLRLLCTHVWPTVYQVLTLQHDDPIRVWGLPKSQAIDLLPEDSQLAHSAREFYAGLHAYYPTESSVEHCLAALGRGLAVLRAAKQWWEATSATA
jgi:hypothetical protein